MCADWTFVTGLFKRISNSCANFLFFLKNSEWGVAPGWEHSPVANVSTSLNAPTRGFHASLSFCPGLPVSCAQEATFSLPDLTKRTSCP